MEIFVVQYLHPDYDIFAFAGVSHTIEDAKFKAQVIRRDIHRWGGSPPADTCIGADISSGVYHAETVSGKTVAYIWHYKSNDVARATESRDVYVTIDDTQRLEDVELSQVFLTLDAAKAHVEENESCLYPDWYHPQDSGVWFLYLGVPDASYPFSVTRVVKADLSEITAKR